VPPGSNSPRQTCTPPSCTASCSSSGSSMHSVHSSQSVATPRLCASPSLPACPAAGLLPPHQSHTPCGHAPPTMSGVAFTLPCKSFVLHLVCDMLCHTSMLCCVQSDHISSKSQLLWPHAVYEVTNHAAGLQVIVKQHSRP